MKTNDKLTGKIIFTACVENDTPLLVATGQSDTIDFEVILDNNGHPYIPASGFAGMMREKLYNIDLATDTKLIKHRKYFLGTDSNDQYNSIQSHVIIDDLKCTNYRIVERDGVKINHKTNLGEDKSKFNYQLIEPGAVFSLKMEVTLRQDYEPGIILKFLDYIASCGIKKEFQQGAFKSSGFGILEFSKIEIFEFCFPENGNEWLDFLKNDDKKNLKNKYGIVKNDFKTKTNNKLIIQGEFEIHNSLIIASKGDEIDIDKDKAPDKTHLKNSDKKNLLTGKSIKGAIRHRAEKIINTIGNSSNSGIIDELFGYVKDNKKAKVARLKSFETIIDDVIDRQIQPRIKIDRFTGGTIEHALMQTEPLWHKEEKINIKFEIIDCSVKEAGLMLLVMRDLMTSDLAIGGEKSIGRGTLKGIDMKISGTIDSEMYEFAFSSEGITDTSKIETINKWVKSLQIKNDGNKK